MMTSETKDQFKNACLIGLAVIWATCLLFRSLASAEPPAPRQDKTPKAPSATSLSFSPKKKDYAEWLESYHVWDKLNDELAASNQTEGSILRQATIAMEAGRPDKALSIVESSGVFVDNNATEADRLWIGAQAYRALGNPEMAVFWHLQAAEIMSEKRKTRRMRTEPGLDYVWKDVFRKLFQVYIANSQLSSEAQAEYLERCLGQAAQAWPSDNFWKSANKALAESQLKKPAESNQIYSFNSGDLSLIARSIAAYSIEGADANATLIDISDRKLGSLWFGIIDQAESGSMDLMMKAAKALPPSRVKHFAESMKHPSIDQLSGSWKAIPASRNFNDFRNNARHLSIAEMHRLFKDGKEESLMIGAVSEEELAPYKLALAIAADDRQSAEQLWADLDSVTLPNSLKLAGMLYFKYDFDQVFRRSPDMTREHDQNWLILLEAAGHRPPLPHMISFWQPVIPAKNRRELIHKWPLDLNVMLEVWKYDWAKTPKRSLARRILYLYPDEQFGKLCALYLAEEALKDKQIALSDYYIGAVNPSDTNSTLTAEYYRVSAEQLMFKEDIEGAYSAYQQLVSTGTPIDDTTRMKIAFLLQQRGELEAGREHLLKLWQRKDDFDTSMQAEILFYLAEGEQAMGLSDQALDYYLHLAWQYPQESMWALTAMYRSASIYEAREQYDPAVKLLKTVVKNAQTGKQKEAALSRLENIQARQAKDATHGTGAVPYPF